VETCLYLEERATIFGNYLRTQSSCYSGATQYLCAVLFQSFQKNKGLLRTETGNKLQLSLKMLISVDFVDIQTNHVDNFNDNFLQAIFQLSVVDKALILMQIHGKYTILCDFIAPERNDLRHGIFLESSHRNCFQNCLFFSLSLYYLSLCHQTRNLILSKGTKDGLGE